MGTNNQIKLVQLPVIEHKLKEAGQQVSLRLEALEIDKQIATVDTLKPLKSLRAELNKELANFEDQRKFIKKAVNTPYNDFENVYSLEIATKYKEAIDTLKDKITFVEDKVKANKEALVKDYFSELCVAENIDFVSFDQLNLDIKLSVTEKKYKQQVFDFISKINDDLKLINTTVFKAEILTEYKTSLNVSNAITTVNTRKENEAKEAAKLKAEKIHYRKVYLQNIGMQHVAITNAYEYNADVYITVEDIENLSKEDFTKKFADLEIKINALEAAKKESKPDTSIKKPTETKTAAPIAAPKVENKQEPLKKASFEVTATMTQLRALGAYLKQNNITYKNI